MSVGPVEDVTFTQITAAVNSYVLPNEPAFASERTYGALFIVAGSTSLLSIRGAVERLKTPSK